MHVRFQARNQGQIWKFWTQFLGSGRAWERKKRERNFSGKKMERVAEWVRKPQPRNQRDFWCVHGRPWVVQEIGEKILRFLGCRGLGFGCKKSPSLEKKKFGAIRGARPVNGSQDKKEEKF